MYKIQIKTRSNFNISAKLKEKIKTRYITNFSIRKTHIIQKRLKALTRNSPVNKIRLIALLKHKAQGLR